MEQTFDLNKMGLAPMTGEEMRDVDGGFWWAVLASAIISAVDNFGDIRHGIADGYNGVTPRYQ